MKLKTIVLILLLITGTAFYLSAGGGTESAGFNFAISGNPDTLDPHATSGTLTFQTIRSVYDTLVEPDDTGKLVPALAKEWEVSSDALTWTFMLRENVTFHNGDAFTSADVKATLNRLTAEATASPKASEFAAVTAIETPDDYTVVMNLSEPSAPLLSSLASGWGAILPRDLIQSDHDFARYPVGTGPFRFVEWVADSKIALAKNPGYWKQGYPKIDQLTMNIIVERSVQVQALLAGELDAIFNVNEEDLILFENNPKVSMEKRLTSLVHVMAMNTRRAPLDDLRVRQAINYGIDKTKVLEIAYGGGQVVGTFMDYNDPYYADYADLYTFDPAKATALLAAAGVTDDTEFEMALPLDYEPHVRAGELYQEMLSNIGLNVKIRLVKWATWISDVYSGGNYDFTVIGHTGKLDPNGRLGGYGTEKSYVGWVNPEAADLISRGKTVIGFDDRQELYSRALEIMAEEVPFVYTGTSYRYIAVRAGVTGFRMDQKLDTFDFRYVEK
jgi:peptide/nickel transport system substrate-binding protein